MHVDDPVRSEECIAEVDELVDEVVRAHGGYGCGEGKVFAYGSMIYLQNWIECILEVRGPSGFGFGSLLVAT